MDSISEQFHSILYLNDRYNLLPSLSAKFADYSEEYSKSLLTFLKEVIKSKKNPATVKLQALKLIDSLMSSKNIHITNYCGKKFFNRFKIFAEYRKESKDDRRGTLLFQAEARAQQLASEEFLLLLLKSIKNWAKEFPSDNRGKITAYSKLFNYLVSKGVHFPDEGHKKEKEDLKNVLIRIRKNVKTMFEFIAQNRSFDKIRKIGESLESGNLMIQNQIVKYMDMEDHDLIKDLNSTLDLLGDGKSAFKAWAERTCRVSILDFPGFSLPPSCLFLQDIEPKMSPEPDELTGSILDMQVEEESPAPLVTDRDLETEKDLMLSNEWTGLGADYCRLKDKLEITEQNALNFQLELESLNTLLEKEKEEKQDLIQELSYLNTKLLEVQDELASSHFHFSQENTNLEAKIQTLESTISIQDTTIEALSSENTYLKSQNEALEISSELSSTKCKELEEQVQLLTQCEKLLKKDLKDLQKQLLRLKHPASPMTLSTHLLPSSLITNTEESASVFDDPNEINNAESTQNLENLENIEKIQNSPSKSQLFSVINQVEPDSKTDQLDLPSPTPTLTGFISAREPTSKLTQIDNIDNFKDLILKKHGVLFENLLLKVSSSMQVSGFEGKLKISFKSKSGQALANFKTKLYFDPTDEMYLGIDSEGPESLLNQVHRSIFFRCKGIFQVFPLMKLSFVYEGEKTSIVLLLPISYTLFFHKAEVDLIQEWENIDECIETVVKCEQDSIRKVAKSLVFGRNFQYSYIEGNGVILAGNSPVGIVLAVVSLSDHLANIQVKCADCTLRDLISSMIITQLMPSTSF